jgi:hypothetical protein
VQYLLALLPPLLFVLLLAGLHRTATTPGLIAAALAATLAVACFDYPVTPVTVLVPLFEAAFTSAAILWIIFPAPGIYEFQTGTGATEAIGTWRRTLSPKQPSFVRAILAARAMELRRNAESASVPSWCCLSANSLVASPKRMDRPGRFSFPLPECHSSRNRASEEKFVIRA